MSNRLTKRSRTNYVPAIPEVPARPAYCVTTSGDAVQYVRIDSLKNTGVQIAPGYRIIVQSHVDYTGKTITDGFLVPIIVHNTPITTCYPAQAGIPGRESNPGTDNQVGWNSGARSTDQATGDFDLTFSLPGFPSGAIICGLAPDSAAIGQFSAIEHGLYSSGTTISFYELGVEKHTFQASSQSFPSLRIRRINGVVTATVGGESYRSGTRSVGAKSVTAALYAAGDYVENPDVGRVYAGSSFGALSLGMDAPSSHDALLFRGSASGSDAASGVEPVIGLDGVVTVFDMAMAALGNTLFHDIGVTTVDLSPGLNSAEEFQSGIRLILDEPTVSGTDTDQLLEVNIAEGLAPQASLDFIPMLFATINESLSLETVIDLILGIDAKLFEVLALPTNASANMVLEALLRSGITLSDFSSKARNEALQYATNIATGAVTRYSGFGFSSFCRVGTELWATRPDGLYKIGGSTDNGELLSYLIDFAADDHGSPRTKRLENIFFGISTDGYTYARLSDDFGREQTYRLIQRDSSEARINTAKGASSRFWKLRLEGHDASYAEIDNIEWVTATGARRTKR